MEYTYVLNSLNAVSQAGPLHDLGDTLSRASGVATTLLQRLVGNYLSGSPTTMGPEMVVVLAVVSFIVLFMIGCYALLVA